MMLWMMLVQYRYLLNAEQKGFTGPKSPFSGPRLFPQPLPFLSGQQFQVFLNDVVVE